MYTRGIMLKEQPIKIIEISSDTFSDCNFTNETDTDIESSWLLSPSLDIESVQSTGMCFITLGH